MRTLLACGALVAVLALQVGGASAQVSEGTIGEQRVLLVLVTWGPEPVTLEDARSAVAETEEYVSETSFGRASLEVDVRGWVRALARRPTGCDTTGVHDAVRRSMDLTGYDLVAFLMPRMDCGWGGAYFPPGVWMLDRISKSLFAHELGHNWGVREEGAAWLCGNGRCRAENYASPYSVMGHGSGHFNAFEKWRFGWIDRAGPSLRDDDYRIARIDRPSELPHALFVLSGADEYWIEYRPEVTWPVVHVSPSAVRVTPSRFPQRNLLLAGARGDRFAVRGSFEVVRAGSDGDSATLRFRWLDRTRPSRPRLDVARRKRLVTLGFPASDEGSGVERYELTIDSRLVTLSTGELQGRELVGRDPVYFVRLGRGPHTVTVTAVDRAGNRSRPTTRTVRVP